MKALIDGDIWLDGNGYQRHGRDQYVHRTIAEKVLGRKLKGAECVHHIDYDKSNNGLDNLVICPNEKYHKLLHARQRVLELGGHPDQHKYCTYHCELHEKSEFSTRPQTWDGLHNMCRKATNEYRKNRGLNRDKFDWRARLNQQYRRVFKGYNNRDICQINPREDSL